MKELYENERKSITSQVMACLVAAIILLTTIGSLILYFKVEDKPFEFAYEDSNDVEEEKTSIGEVFKVVYHEGGYSDVDLLAGLLKMETCGDFISEKNKRLGIIVLNRVRIKYYPDTIFDVIFEPNQFWCSYYEEDFYNSLSLYDIDYYKEIAEELILASKENDTWEKYCKDQNLTTITCSCNTEIINIEDSVDEIVERITNRFGSFYDQNISLIVINYKTLRVEVYYELKEKNKNDLSKPQIEIISRD